MALLRQRLLILLILVLGGAQVFAANTREERAFAAAMATFQDENWNRAETEFAQFAQRFSKSARIPAVILAQAQAQFKQGKFAAAADLLTGHADGAGGLADAYVYWLGESQFAKGDFTNAAATFSTLAKNFPDSPLRLTAVVEAAAAYAQFPDWSRHDALLEATNGIFARAAALDPNNALVINGRLSLAQGKLAQHNFTAAGKYLELLDLKALAPEQDWERLNLLYQVKLAQGNLDAALVVTTNLMESAKNIGHMSDSVAMHASALEKKQLPAAALGAWMENLTNGAPVERQREAVLKIAALAAAQGDGTNAAASLEKYLAQFPNSPVAELVLLTLGELHLKDFLATSSADQLAAAQTNFDRFIGAFANSPLTGKACLDRGWCNWQASRYAESLVDFRAAAQWWVADSFYRAGNFIGAETNYELIYQTPTWKNSTLIYPAQLMASRAAVGRLGFDDAKNYLIKMLADTNCPPALMTQAMFAYGGVLMRLDPPDTSRPLANFELATNVFAQISAANPTNELGSLAGSELGDCYLQLGALDAATNAYAQVVNSRFASAGLRNRAQLGWGRVLEKKAEATAPEARKPLQLQALKIYWDVVYDPTSDAFWAKKAGLQALPLMTATGEGNVDKFYTRLETLLPQLKDSLDKKKAALKN